MLVQRNKALHQLNTLALPASAQAFASVSSDTEIDAAVEWAHTHKLPVLPLGHGSNVVFSGDINALVLQLQSRGIEVLEQARGEVVLRVAAGESWHQLVQWTLDRGFYGLQNLALIPGTVGAAPVQNIGAYGVEIESTVLRVHALQISNRQRLVLHRDDCEFSYRDSIFKRQLKDRVIITAVDLVLSLLPVTNISYPALQRYFDEHSSLEHTPEAVYQAVVGIRRRMLPDPAKQPNAGSFFKNPVVSATQAQELVKQFPELPNYPQQNGRVKLPAAWMIDHCGWKGLKRHGLGVHPQHALVLVNCGTGNGEQLLALAGDIEESVHKAFGIKLQIEPRLYGQSHD